MRQIYEINCKHCNTSFCHVDRRSKYCPLCSEKRVWLYKKYNSRNYGSISKKIQTTKKQWLSSDEAKLFYKKLGQKNSKSLKKHFQTDEGKKQIKRVAKIQSHIMKERIATGQWTPNITNTWTHWDAKIEFNGTTKRFRSSWEACVWLSNPSWEYETIRVPYKNSVVICDFVDTKNRIVYEVKPCSRYRVEKTKINAIIKWCLDNQYKFIWINEHNILSFVDKSVFVDNENILQLDKLMIGIKYATRSN